MMKASKLRKFRKVVLLNYTFLVPSQYNHSRVNLFRVVGSTSTDITEERARDTRSDERDEALTKQSKLKNSWWRKNFCDFCDFF